MKNNNFSRFEYQHILSLASEAKKKLEKQSDRPSNKSFIVSLEEIIEKSKNKMDELDSLHRII